MRAHTVWVESPYCAAALSVAQFVGGAAEALLLVDEKGRRFPLARFATAPSGAAYPCGVGFTSCFCSIDGFCMALDGGRKLTCCGDEPLREAARRYAEGSDWLLHEAFCLSGSGGEHSRVMGRSTVRDACEIAQRLGVSDLFLYHTQDRDLPRRKQLYTQQARQCFAGQVHIPDDLETLLL